MADRFPSLEDFSEGQTEVVENNVSADDDFLARERAALGEDADQFATPQDNVAEGLEGEMTYWAATRFPQRSSDNLRRVAPSGTITGSGSPFPTSGYVNPMETEAESEAVREWREKRDAEIARRAEVSNEKKEATIKKAREDIDDFYVSYNNKSDKHRAQTKTEAEQFLASREDTSAGGTSWERIAKLVDISGKGAIGGGSGSGKERFREMLIDLRKDQEAPGASGI
ncbi:Clathrin light chain [Penicillium maclennaniae]|uniref:Clathrin light chain n=1 Tax=Penicillium maclennaniae TaxID=1343394 RepID=UPI0025405174|nr:Clathrin light chain [Penicillium maclennaniae]KAJ5661793.1 Clathrin light chain [Penicillium maclennaniae]